MAITYSDEGAKSTEYARAMAKSLPISLKKSVELASAIRGKKLSSVINYLERVIKKEAVVPYKRYKAETAHRRGAGIDTGGYPVNVAKEFLKLANSLKSNASEKEISGELYLISVSARKGPARYHMGRMPGRRMKATHVEMLAGVPKK